MNKSRKFLKLELLNFEGPVLVAHRAKKVFVITDQWKEVVDILIDQEMEDFINGEFSIIDSKGKSWLYTKEHSNAKRSIDEVSNFIKL
jgi:hypothetical protein